MKNPARSAAKPPLILIHGFRGAPLGLAKIADILRGAGYEVYTPAVPPFAGAGELPEYTPAAYAEFIKDYIAGQKLPAAPVLIGHSMGSLVAGAAAMYHPNILAKQLIFLSPISVKPSLFFRQLTPLSTALPRRTVDYITTRFLATSSDIKNTLKLTHACSAATKPSHAITASAKFSANTSLSEYDIKNKDILLVAGAKDRLVPYQKTAALAAKLSIHNTTELATLMGTGHLHNYEQPEATAETILAFLRKASCL